MPFDRRNACSTDFILIFGRGRIHPPRIACGLDKSSPYII